MRDGSIEHVRLLVRKRRTPTEADGNEKNQDAEKTLHAREKHLTRIRGTFVNLIRPRRYVSAMH